MVSSHPDEGKTQKGRAGVIATKAFHRPSSRRRVRPLPPRRDKTVFVRTRIQPPRRPPGPRPDAESARYPYARRFVPFFREGRQTNLQGCLPALVLTQSPPVTPTPGIQFVFREGWQANLQGRLPALIPPQSPPVLPCDGKNRYEHPLVEPHVMHLRQVPLRTRVK
jgi:hypothetical protein